MARGSLTADAGLAALRLAFPSADEATLRAILAGAKDKEPAPTA